MFNKVSNKNSFEIFFSEIEKDFSTATNNELNKRVRLLAAIKLSALAGMGIGAIFTIGTISTFLSGAVLLASLKAMVAAATIIFSHDLFVAAKNEQAVFYSVNVIATAVWSTTVQLIKKGNINLAGTIDKARLETTFKNTWFKEIWIKIGLHLINKQTPPAYKI